MKTKNFFLLIPILLILSYLSLQAQDALPQTVDFEIDSDILKEKRELSVFLPPGYHSSEDIYPVLFLLDGRTHFNHATGAVEFLSNNGFAPGIIVVSIVNVDRFRDFSPVPVERMPTSGGAEKFLNFLSLELVPHLADNYRVSGFNILMGHSLGGVFAAYALIEQPELFDAYIAISPFLQYADNYIVKESNKNLHSNHESMKFFFMTIGNEPDYFTPLKEFSDIISGMTGSTIKFEYNRMMDEDHISIPYNSLYNGLRFIFSDWQFPREKLSEGLTGIDAHYAKISTLYGMEIPAPEIVINLLGYTYLQNQQIELAISTFRENVKRYPLSSNVYDSLGEAYENDKQYTSAQQYYQKAYELGLKSNDPNTQVYKQNLERVHKNNELQ